MLQQFRLLKISFDDSKVEISTIHGSKVILCIWWDQKGVIYYELLKPEKTITGERYRTQLIRLNTTVKEIRPECAESHNRIILQQDNAQPHITNVVRTYLESFDS